MAELNVFKKTGSEPTQADFSHLDKGNIRPTGVGLREGEIKALDAIGAALGDALESEPIARNALIRIAVRSLLKSYISGSLTLQDLAGEFYIPERPKPQYRP